MFTFRVDRIKHGNETWFLAVIQSPSQDKAESMNSLLGFCPNEEEVKLKESPSIYRHWL